MPLGVGILPPETSSGRIISSSLGRIAGQVVGAATGVGGAGGLKPGKLSSMLGGQSEEEAANSLSSLLPNASLEQRKALINSEPALRNTIISNMVKQQEQERQFEQQKALIDSIFNRNRQGQQDQQQAATVEPEAPQQITKGGVPIDRQQLDVRDQRKAQLLRQQLQQQGVNVAPQQVQQQQQVAQQQQAQAQQIQQQPPQPVQGGAVQAQQQQVQQQAPQPVQPAQQAPQQQTALPQATVSAIQQNQQRLQQPANLTDQQIAAVSIVNPQLGNNLRALRESRTKSQDKAADRHWSVAKKVFEEADKEASTLEARKNSLQLIDDGIKNRGVLGFTSDLLADITGIKGFRTGRGAQVISAGKEFLLSSIKRAGARPNQWIEKQIQKALQDVGNTDEANEVISTVLALNIGVEERRHELISEVANEMEADPNAPYVKRNLGAEVNKRLKVYSEEQLELTIDRIAEITGEKPPGRTTSSGVPKGSVRIRLPDGSTGTLPDNPKAIKNAQKHFGAEVIR